MRRTLLLPLVIACSGDVDRDPSPEPDPGEARQGCDGATFLGTSTDPAVDGPWDVGARTVRIGRLTAEIWYPAAPGSADGAEPARYDIREALGALSGEIPDDDNPWQPCDCVRDQPLDDAHGPYPVVVFVHGTASFRHQSLTLMTHWASRGFVVVAADHPGLMLGDFLSQLCPGDPSGAQDLSADLDAILAAIAARSGELGFLDGHVDAARIGIAGHSAGGGAAAAASTRPGVRVVLPLAANGSSDAPSLYIGGLDDAIVDFAATSGAWQESATPRYLVGIERSGHLFCSDLCETRNAEGQNLLEIAQEHELCGADLAGFLFDCDPTYVDARPIVEWATANLLERTLQCRADLPPVEAIEATFAEVASFEQAL